MECNLKFNILFLQFQEIAQHMFFTAFSHWYFMHTKECWLPSWAIQLFYPAITKAVEESPKKMVQWILQSIEDHRRTFDPDHPRDVMDLYIKHRSEDKNFTDHRFASTMYAYFLDSTGTLGIVLLYTLCVLALHPSKYTFVVETFLLLATSLVGRKKMCVTIEMFGGVPMVTIAMTCVWALIGFSSPTFNAFKHFTLCLFVTIFYSHNTQTILDLEWKAIKSYHPLQTLSMFSEDQEKAQKQIQSVCGGRKPRLDDRSSLTVVEAIILETLRSLDICKCFHPSLGLGQLALCETRLITTKLLHMKNFRILSPQKGIQKFTFFHTSVMWPALKSNTLFVQFQLAWSRTQWRTLHLEATIYPDQPRSMLTSTDWTRTPGSGRSLKNSGQVTFWMRNWTWSTLRKFMFLVLVRHQPCFFSLSKTVSPEIECIPMPLTLIGCIPMLPTLCRSSTKKTCLQKGHILSLAPEWSGFLLQGPNLLPPPRKSEISVWLVFIQNFLFLIWEKLRWVILSPM